MTTARPVVEVETPVGVARLHAAEATQPRLRLVLGPGASGAPNARDLMALAGALPDHGVSVVRVEPPWRVAGKRIAPRPPVIDDAWQAVVAALPADVPLLTGGRSSGARAACRTAVATGAAGVVALAFPLHLPGRPEKSRFAELAGSGVPTLVVQGERDTFGRPDEFGAGEFDLVTVAHADHGMAVPKADNQQAALAVVVDAVLTWLDAREWTSPTRR